MFYNILYENWKSLKYNLKEMVTLLTMWAAGCYEHMELNPNIIKTPWEI